MKQLKLLLATELELCEQEIKYYTDLGYSEYVPLTIAYWRGRKDEVQKIRDKIEKGANNVQNHRRYSG